MPTRIPYIVAVASTLMIGANPSRGAQRPTSKPAALPASWGDQGDGTFVNPIIPGDYSDLDAIRSARAAARPTANCLYCRSSAAMVFR